MYKSIISYLWAFLIGVGMMLSFFKPAIGLGILSVLGMAYFIVDDKLKLSDDLMP